MILKNVSSYEDFRSLANGKEIDPLQLLSHDGLAHLAGLRMKGVLTNDSSDLITKYAIRYTQEYFPDKIASAAMADKYASEGVRSPPLINPYWPDDCRPLFHLGYWPVMWLSEEYSALLYIENGEDAREIGAYQVADDIDSIEGCLEWIYTPVGILQAEGVRTGKGFQLSLQAPDLVYSSNRPKTDMTLFRNTNSNRLPISRIVNGKCVIDGVEWSAIPVTRYADGMSRSLYYSDNREEKSYCGTFYYHEPESTTYLAYQKVFRAFNKTAAMQALLAEAGREVATEEDHSWRHKWLMDHIAGKLPRDLLVEADNGITYYGGNLAYDLYAAEDELDQPLCKLAAELGYDIVILESMVGSFQVVTEVLDVRSRQDSFLSLIYTY